jgi:Family of unknown function (DUF6488)
MASDAFAQPFQPAQGFAMKTLVTVSALVITLFTAPAALADAGGSCHFHGSKPATEAVITDCANQRKASLVKTGKIDASWQAVKHDKLELIDGKKGKEWKVTFRNPAVTDAAKQTLYIFFSQPGNFIVANHTGQ